MAGDPKGFAKLKPAHQIFVVMGLCAALLGAVWYWMLSPIQEDIATKEGQLGQLQSKVALGLARKAVLDQFKRETKMLEAKLEDLKSILPRERETDEVLRQVQSSAQSSGLKIRSIIPRPLVEREVFLTEWPLQMEVGGTYHDVGKFLDKIRNLPRIVNIGGLKLVTVGGGSSPASTNVTATYTATTFVYREEANAGAAKPAKGN